MLLWKSGHAALPNNAGMNTSAVCIVHSDGLPLSSFPVSDTSVYGVHTFHWPSFALFQAWLKNIA